MNIDEENIYDQPAKSPKKLEYPPSDKRLRKHVREKAASTNESEEGKRSTGSLQSKSNKKTNSIERSDVLTKSITKDKHGAHRNTNVVHKDRKINEVTSHDKTSNDTKHKLAEKHSSERSHGKHKHGSAHGNPTTSSLEKAKEENYGSVGKKRYVEKREMETKLDDKQNSKRRDRSRSKDSHEAIPTSDQHQKTKKSAPSESDTSLKLDRNKRREYVINYDDKKGTVSSICQLKPGTSKRKIIHPERTKEMKLKTKSSDKSSLRK